MSGFVFFRLKLNSCSLKFDVFYSSIITLKLVIRGLITFLPLRATSPSDDCTSNEFVWSRLKIKAVKKTELVPKFNGCRGLGRNDWKAYLPLQPPLVRNKAVSNCENRPKTSAGSFPIKWIKLQTKKDFRNRELEFKIEFVMADNRSLIFDAQSGNCAKKQLERTFGGK